METERSILDDIEYLLSGEQDVASLTEEMQKFSVATPVATGLTEKAECAIASTSSAASASTSTAIRKVIKSKKRVQESFLSEEKLSEYEKDISLASIVGSDSDAGSNFADIKATTFGLSGAFSNILFDESNLIKYVQARLRYPCILANCNFGEASTAEFKSMVASGQISTVSMEKSARARAKKRARACRVGGKPRKVQGNGTCFNSSILFWIYSEKYGVVYKIRLFRTGQFGLPGTKPHMTRDIYELCTKSFAPMIRDILQAAADAGSGATSAAQLPMPELISLSSIMKNYKWCRYIDDGEMIDLRALYARMIADNVAQKTPYHVHYITHANGDAKLSVKFVTPMGDDQKHVRVNIFLSGKINILGAYESETTKKICQYIVGLLESEQYITVKNDTAELDDVDADQIVQ